MTHRNRPAAFLLLALGLALAPSARAMPSVEFFHFGALVPEDASEGWTRMGGAVPGVLDQGVADVEIGPLDPDVCQGCGLTSWGIDDRAAVAGSTLRYEHTPSQQQVEDASTLGWTLRVRLRLPADSDNQLGGDDPVDASVMAEFREGTFAGQQRFRILFGTELYSPIVSLSGTSEEYYDVVTGSAHFGVYELMYRPDLGSATLFVDGVERISGYVGEAALPGAPGVAWGSDSEAGLGRGHFNLVEWELGLPACFDGIDNDGDGLFDLADPSCMNDPNGATEDHGTECDDGVDNDGDGDVDLADPSCIDDPTQVAENLATACDDGIDNDGDGDVDLADPTCAGDPRNVAEVTACDDGVDSDADGRVDLADAGCLADVTRNSEAGEIVVTTTLDKFDANSGDGICETDVPGECSLRAAIDHSNGTGVVKGVQLPAGDYDVDLVYSPSTGGGALRITGDLVLIGDGASVTRIGPGTPIFYDPIFRILSSGHVGISGVTIRGGTGSGGSGISVLSGDLTLTDSTISGNAATSQAGGLSNSGYRSHVKLIRSRITGNTATWVAGGLTNGIRSTLEVIDSTISVNSADNSGAGLLNGITTITNSTISGNTALSSSHGVGGLKFSAGHHQVTNSTFSGNVGATGGGLMVDDSDVTLTNVTATDNTPNGICTWTLGGVPYVENSVIAGNNGVNCGFPSDPPTSLGYNLSDDASCPFVEVGDLQNVASPLGPLADNGGPTLTHALLAGSPAIDAADDAICPSTDQRGVSRPLDGDADSFADCDMGAVEYLPEPAGVLPLALGFLMIQGLDRNARRRRPRQR